MTTIKEETTRKIARDFSDLHGTPGWDEGRIVRKLAADYGISETSVRRHAEGVESVKAFKAQQREYARKRKQRRRAKAIRQNGHDPNIDREDVLVMLDAICSEQREDRRWALARVAKKLIVA